MKLERLVRFENWQPNGNVEKNFLKLKELLSKFEIDIYSKVPVITSTGVYILASEKGEPNGIAELGSDGRVPADQLPSFGDLSAEIAARILGDTSLQSSKQNVIVHGSVVLDASGTYTIPCTSILADSEVFLSPGCGNSNMRIDPANIVAGVSFDIVSSGGADDNGLTVRYLVL